MVLRSVAIIGGGPSGIATLYEALHTLRDGTSIVGQDASKYSPDQFAFDAVVLFERNSTIGGTWSRSECGKLNREPNLPVLDGQEDKPDHCYRSVPIPPETELTTSSYDAPYVSHVDAPPREYQWASTGVYDGLFTNIAYNAMTFSFAKDLEMPKRRLGLLQPWEEVTSYLEAVVAEHDLDHHVRYNSTVEEVYKVPGDSQWKVTVREQRQGKEVWYVQKFDGVVIANGRTIPYVPVLQQFDEFQKRAPPGTLIKHCKNISNPQNLKNSKKILFVGCSISTADLIQYCFPRPEDSVFISRRNPSADFDWVNHATYSAGLVSKPEISHFDPDTNSVHFLDGTSEADFDAIILCTGYHRYFPFLRRLEHDTGVSYHEFHDHAFSAIDTSLAVVGTVYTAFFFNRAEASAAAIAGVWCGYRSCDPKLMALKPDKYKVWDIKTKFIQFLLDKYGTKNRFNPLDTESRKEIIRDYGHGFRIVAQLFDELKNGVVSHDEVFQ